MNRKILLVLSCIVFLVDFSKAQSANVFRIDSISEDPVELNKFWKVHEGDDSLWSQFSFDDAKWDTIDITDFPKNKNAIHWYRLKLRIDSSLMMKPMALLITQTGASEFFLDGQRLETFGHVSSDKKEEEGYEPKTEPHIFNFSATADHVLAIRYSNHLTNRTSQSFGPVIQIAKANEGISSVYNAAFVKTILTDITLGFFAGLTFLHLMLYFFYRSDKNNLYYSLFTGIFTLMLFSLHFYTYHTNSALWTKINFMLPVIYPVFFCVIFLLAARLFDRPPWFFYYVTLIVTVATIILYFFKPFLYSFFIISLVFHVSISILFTIRYAYKKKKDGVVILGTGLFLTAIFLIIMLTILIINNGTISLSDNGEIVFIIVLMASVLSIPVSMSIYLARNFAIKSKTLNIKLNEVQELSEKTIFQAKEKEELLSTQNERLERQVNERTAEVTDQKNKLEKQKELLEIKSKEVLESLNYARYLQQVILPHLSFIKEKVKDSFILYKPKDIVAGDFYFAEEVGDYFFIAAADCTGHGVPGAMLSVLCSNALNQAVKEFSLTDPGEILDKTNELVAGAFEKSRQHVNDGMDISFLALNKKDKKISWAGAYNHIWYTVNGSLMEIKGNKQPIGKYENRSPFTTHDIPWQTGCWFYLFTDGYADQFGGSEGKKFMRKNLSDLITSIQKETANEQLKILEETFSSWSGNLEQVDDVTILGIEI